MRVEYIRELPRHVELQLQPYGAKDYARAREHGVRVVEDSREAAVVYVDERPILVAGVSQWSMLGMAGLWFLLCNDFHVCYIKQVRKMFNEWRRKYPVLYADIECSFIPGRQFARLFGFRPLGVQYSYFGKEYELYEVR